jgi:gliding motility-associated-like protein
LPVLSNNIPPIAGTWNDTVDTSVPGTFTYTFTPDPAVCATTAQLSVVVTPPVNPGFSDIAFCSGSAVPPLHAVSPNGTAGTWQPSTIDNLVAGSYVFTPNDGQCAVEQTIQTTIYEASLASVEWTVTDAFSDNQMITVLASGAGNYLYQLNYGPQQQSNVFEHVPSGVHTITVYDANGCADPITEEDVLVVNYPHFFTPNGDGRNDMWNIAGLRSDAQIFIFDRFGKLLKQLGAESAGWDGTSLGTQLPSSDYWFKVIYDENGVTRQFNAHFTLTR